MSPEKQKTSRIIEGGRVWPYYESTGIPVLPRKTKCIGREKCPAIARKGFCNPNTIHHLLFAKNTIKSYGYPYNSLVNNDFMKVSMAECRHNYYLRGITGYALHHRFDRSEVPDRTIAYQFTDESRLLAALLSSAMDIHKQVFYGVNSFEKYKGYDRDEKLFRISERFIDASCKFEHVRSQIDSIEVIPHRIVQKAIYDAFEKRASAREVFSDVSFVKVPHQLIEAAVEVRLLPAA